VTQIAIKPAAQAYTSVAAVTPPTPLVVMVDWLW